jgi:hypothetical protein
MSSTDNRSRKILIPLATMAVAAAVVVGSGATWTSESDNHVSVTAGQIVHVNAHNGATLSVTRLKPGSEVSETLTITEGADNNLDSTLKMVPSKVASGITAGDLLVKVAGNGQDAGFVNFEKLAQVDLGALDDGYGSTVITITVKMPTTAGSENQGKAASADLKFVTTTTTGAEKGTTVGW